MPVSGFEAMQLHGVLVQPTFPRHACARDGDLVTTKARMTADYGAGAALRVARVSSR